jgi:hypothetical protein
MATRKCPFCKEKVREDAMLCKHCKSELPPLPPKKWYQTWWGLLLVLFGLMIIANVFGLKTNPKPETPPSPEELARKQYFSDDIDARVYAKIYVEKRLKSPSTAKFQNTADFAVAPAKDKKGKPLKDVWEVSGYVDAQNSFGAMLRNQFYIKLIKTGDKWVPMDIKMW